LARGFARTLAQKERKSMSSTLIVIGASVLAAFVVSAVQFAKERPVWNCLRLIGAAFLLVVVVSHLAEQFQWLAWMGWGLADSPGHYIDLVSAVVGVGLFAGGFLVWSVTRGRGAARFSVGSELDRSVREYLGHAFGRVADLHLWQVGPGYTARVAVIVSHDPQAPKFYKTLGKFPGSHATVEAERCASARFRTDAVDFSLVPDRAISDPAPRFSAERCSPGDAVSARSLPRGIAVARARERQRSCGASFGR
jgi:hypothetical protein